MINNDIQLNFFSFTDVQTGALITRLTPPDVTCHRNYFYQKCFSNDGENLLFAGEFGGFWNYYWLNLESQIAKQLTDGKGDNTFGGFISADDQYLFYVKLGRYLKRVSLKDSHEDNIYEVPSGWVGYGTWAPNSTTTKVVGIEIKAEDFSDLKDWKEFHEMFYRKPYCRLISVDLSTGERQVIYEDKIWLGHPLYRPFHDNQVAFCHEGPHDLVDARMWFIDANGHNMRCGKQHKEGESCTHEFFVPDGSAMLYVSYQKGESERYIYRLNPDNLENKLLMKMPNCSHLMSNYDGSFLVGDGADAPIDVNDQSQYKIENDPNLYLFDVQKKSCYPLAQHKSSWKVYNNNRQVTHPHPSFTPDGRQVLYTSDFEGKPSIYLALIP